MIVYIIIISSITEYIIIQTLDDVQCIFRHRVMYDGNPHNVVCLGTYFIIMLVHLCVITASIDTRRYLFIIRPTRGRHGFNGCINTL